MSQFLTWLEVEEHRVTFPYQPSAHGIVERANREVIAHIKTLMLEVPRFHVGSWCATIPWVARIMNARRNRSTGFAPYTLVFGRQLNSDIRQYEELPSFRREVVEGVVPSKVYHGKQLDQLTNGLAAMRQVANQMLDSEAIRNRESSLEGERLEPLAEGDYVLKFVHGGLLTKVMPRWCGPYKVAVVLDDDNYLLQNLVQDYNEHDDARRHELVKVICRDDQHAIAEHQKDSFELTPTKVISHNGNADQVGSLFFTCEVEEFEEPQVFRFNDIKFTKVVQDYIKKSGKGPNGLAKLIHSIEVAGEKGRGNRLRTVPEKLR